MRSKLATVLFCGLLTTATFSNFSTAASITVTPTTNRVLPGSVRTVYSNVQGDANVAVTWATNGGTLQNHTGYTVWTAPSTPGTYTVTATSVADGTKSDSSTFTVISDAVVKVSNIPYQATIFKGQPIVIQSILWGSTNTAVLWSNSGGTLRGTGREVVFSATTAGTYTVTSTSQADNTKTATTTIVVTNNPWPGVATPNKTMPIDCTATGSGTTYEVTSESNMDNVPWATLGPGDTVRIHAGSVYYKQIIISTSGTETQPIRVCGVSDGSGNLPELNGANANAKAGSSYGNAPYGLQQYGGIVIYNLQASYYEGASYPKNIIIEGLKVTGYHPTNTFYDSSIGGALTTYDNGAAPVRIQHGRNISIRGNDFQNSGNGFFVMSNNSVESNTTRNLLVEGNHFYNNGVTTYEHQSYIQAFGLVVQGNYYDFPKIGVLGSELKTRSVQQFIRYNYFEPAGRVLDLVEVEDSQGLVFPWVGLDSGELVNTSTSDVVANYEAYQNRYVYGNIVHNVSPDIATYKTSSSIVHISADDDQTNQPGGILYFYNNTIWDTMVASETSNWRTYIIDAGPYFTAINANTVFPSAQLTNNAVYIAQSNPPSEREFSWNVRQPDRVILDKNWISTGWGTGNLAGGDGTGISATAGDSAEAVWQGGQLSTQVSGISNLITGTSIPFNATSYVPPTGSPLVNASVPLTGLAASLPPLMQYSPVSHLMSIRENTLDIGALGFGLQTITFGVIPQKITGDAPFGLTATATSGLPVSFTSSNPAVATVSGTTVTIIGVGTTEIAASQAGNAGAGGAWKPAINVIRTLSVKGTQTTVTTTKAKIFFGTDDNFTVSNSGASVYGSPGNDIVTIGNGITGIILDQNIERINLPGAAASYQFKQTGNKINVYDTNGTTLLVTAPVQGDSDGTQISFSDGSAAAQLTGGIMTFGGATVTSAITPLSPILTATTPTTANSSKAKIYLGADDTFTVSNSGATLYGGFGIDTVTISAGASGVTLDQNVERINLPGTAASYQFKQTGNKINVYGTTGTTLLVSAPVQGDSDGTILSFSDGKASALLVGGVMTVGGSTVSSTVAGLSSPTIIP